MTDRKTLSITKACYDRLFEAKREDESWTDCLSRLVDGDDEHGLNAVDPLTRDDVDDIVTRTASKTADEVENRLTRR